MQEVYLTALHKKPQNPNTKKTPKQRGKKMVQLKQFSVGKGKCSLPRAIETSSEKCGENYQIIYQPGMYPPEKCFEKPGG